MKKPDSPQPAVKVNGEVLGVDVVALSTASPTKTDTAPSKEAVRQVLEQLINQQLLVQQAREKKLEDDPKVALALENARRSVLAQAYLRKVISVAPKPDQQAIADFYSSHPALYAQRRLYRFNQVAIAGTGEDVGALQAKLQELDKMTDRAAIMPALVTWLQSRNTKFRAGSVTHAAEQLPLDLLPKFHAMKEGDVIALPVQGGFGVMQLAASQSQPVDLDKAKGSIEERLLQRSRAELTQKEIKRLRETAKIEYFGEYQKAAAPDKAGEQAGLPSPVSDAAVGSDRDPSVDGAAPTKQ